MTEAMTLDQRADCIDHGQGAPVGSVWDEPPMRGRPDGALRAMPAEAVADAWFRASFEQASVGMAHVNFDGSLILVNDRLCGMLGYTREEAIKLTFRDVTHPDDLAASDTSVRRLLGSGIANRSTEKRYIHKDGSVLWGRLTMSLVRGTDGLPHHCIAVIEDISEHKLAEALLNESEQRFRMLFDAGPLPGYIIDPRDGSIADCNEAAAAMLGYDRGMLRCMRISDIDQRLADARLQSGESVLAGRSARFETQHRTRSGEIRDVMIAAVPVDIGGRRLAHATVVDITERKQAEARFRATFDHAAVGIAHIAPDGRFLRVNDYICRSAGRSREIMLRCSVQDMVSPDQRGEVMEGLRRVAAGEIEAYSGDRHYTSADGLGIDAFVTVSVVHDRVEAPYFLVVAQVITERKKAEDDLRRLTATLGERVREEVAARETAQARAAHAERLHALGQLAGGIAHDFNNVLQAVQGSTAMIARKATDVDTVRRYAGIAAEAATRGASITRRLLSFARRGDLRAEPLDTSAILDGMRDILVPTLGAGISVVLCAEPGLPMVLADRGQMETAIINLATNARDAMPGGGTLTISATADLVDGGIPHPADLETGRYVRITVADTGTGMDQATLAHICEPFFTTKPQGKGTGLGLPMAKGFAEQSGGGVAIDSAPGQGTRVMMWLPQTAAPACLYAKAAAGGVWSASTATPRLLVVDDDPLVIGTLAPLMEDEGFAVTTARSGVEALALLDGGLAVDAIVTDLSMPGMDGITLILGVHARCPALPAILVTGYAGDGVSLALGSKINGPFALVRKPVQAPELAARISAFLSGEKVAPTAEGSLG